jgi:L-lactate utilization protein LutB
VSLDGLSPDLRDRVERTFAALEARGVSPRFATDRRDALATVLGLIPKGSAVTHGTSTTLAEIGFVDHMKRPDCGYRYMNAEWLAENDAAKRGRLRAKLCAESDYFLGSVQAVSETGVAIGCDASGSRQAFYTFGPPHVVWVAGVNKLVPDVDAGVCRVREVALPLEDQRMRAAGAGGSFIGKLVSYERERPGRITLVLVGENLGF